MAGVMPGTTAVASRVTCYLLSPVKCLSSVNRLARWSWSRCDVWHSGSPCPQYNYILPSVSCPQAGALELESAELRFETSADGRNAEVARKRELPMMRTVAEAMIGANAAVAECISKAFPAAALQRRHPPPRAEAFAEVR
jgi:hypothetical protein